MLFIAFLIRNFYHEVKYAGLFHDLKIPLKYLIAIVTYIIKIEKQVNKIK